MTVIDTYYSFELGSLQNLSEVQKKSLAQAFQRVPEAAESRLSGRIRPHIATIDEFGRIVIKHYFRGGILRHVNKRAYLKIGKTRSQAEYEMLARVRSIGVNAPMPVVFASRTTACFFYHAWLATKEISGAKTLAEVAGSTPAHAMHLMPKVAKQINHLMTHGILHVDLHPGNVLIDPHDTVYLVDFDKARAGVSDKARLAGYYMKRWRRAVIKHRLPLFLHEQIKKAVQHQ